VSARAPLLALGALLLAACGGGRVEYGNYRAVLTLPGGELPFGLELREEAGKPYAILRNGSEEVRVGEVSITGSKLRLAMPAYSHVLELEAAGGELRGEARMLRPGGAHLSIPLSARLGESWRFFRSKDPKPARVDGRWAVEFRSGSGTESGIAELRQEGDEVTGTVLTPTGDQRFLAGEVQGRELYLSRFDGGSPYLYHAHLAPDGSLEGRFWSGTWSVEDFKAVRDEHARLDDPGEKAGIKDPTGRFSFSFPDLDGHTVSLADPRFHGKVVVVAIGGSWCPNCHDETAFLVPYFAKLHPRGLEIVYLEFEYENGFAEAVAANRRFVAHYGIPWPVLIGGSSNKEAAGERLPALPRIYGWPTTLFIDRSGKVRRIHTGFSGPATGAHYAAWREEFESLTDTLLAEAAP
jgi:thiol-disulfide isomerase/thioredoxin